jgi:hypothetical protein
MTNTNVTNTNNASNIDWNAINAEADANGELVLQIKLEDGTVVDNPKWAKYKTDVSNDPRRMRGIERMKEFPKNKAEMIRLMKEADAGKDEHDRKYDEVLAAFDPDDRDFDNAELEALSDCLSTTATAWPDLFTRTDRLLTQLYLDVLDIYGDVYPASGLPWLLHEVQKMARLTLFVLHKTADED